MQDNPKWPWITLLLLQILQLASLAPWLMVTAFTVMAFDAPGSANLWQPWAIAITIWSYPLWLILAGLASWILFRYGKYVASVIISSVISLPMFVIVGFLFYVSQK